MLNSGNGGARGSDSRFQAVICGVFLGLLPVYFALLIARWP
jgi:hypothetical protein